MRSLVFPQSPTTSPPERSLQPEPAPTANNKAAQKQENPLRQLTRLSDKPKLLQTITFCKNLKPRIRGGAGREIMPKDHHDRIF
jgi:hypothetical protein